MYDASMSQEDLPPVPSLAARADRLRKQNAKFARRLGMVENVTHRIHGEGDICNSLDRPLDLRRDPFTLADRPNTGIKPLDGE